MQRDYNARSHYLALALDTRIVINFLIEFIDKGIRKPDFDDALEQVLVSVQGGASGKGAYSQLHHSRLAENYEQVQTWDEVLTPDDRKNIVSKLLSLKEHQADINDQKQDALEVLELLGRVENHALYNYRPQSA